MLMYNINSERGTSGWQLLIIASIIFGLLLAVVYLIITRKLSDMSIDAFEKLNEGIKEKVCEVFGIFGQTIGKLFGC
jgi:hypothetical protein